MHLFYRFVQFSVRCIFKFFYKHKTFGEENLPEGAALLAANHASFFDPPIVAASTPYEVHFLARRSLFRFPPFRYLISKLNAHPITGSAQDASSFRVISDLLNQGEKVVLFAEGYRTFDGTLQPVKQGVALLAWRCQCPIVPVYICGSFDVWPRQRRFPKLFGKTACLFGKPIDPKQFAHLEKKEAQQALTSALQESLRSLQNTVK
jgi:1-acyl-sn-glycerol-3-phosphate acyltransferase